MSWMERAIATDKRETAWEIDDHIPFGMQTEGCAYCYRGWAHDPGLLYNCSNCNPNNDVTILI